MTPYVAFYQKRPVPLAEIVERVDLGDPQQAPRVILAVSPCRSGSTVLLRVFGAAGIPAHYQKIKAVLRWRLQDGEARWQLPHPPGGVLFIKETLGPYTEAEATLNPLQVLLDAGLPPDKLHVLILGRTPLNSWASWVVWWGQKTAVQHFVLAYQTIEAIRQMAGRVGVPSTTLVYESLRDNQPATVVRRLFARLGVPYTPIAVSGWHALPPFGTPESNIFFPDEPPAFFVPNVHDYPMMADGLVFTSRTTAVSQLDPADISILACANIPAIYDQWRIQCEEDLLLATQPDPEWDLLPDVCHEVV